MATASAAPGKDGALVGKPRLVEKTKTVAIYDITYWSTGLKVKGMLFENRTAGKKKLPGVVFNHGGVDGIPHLMKQRCKELAARGYHVLAPSYRGEDGSEGEVEVAAGEVDDALNAVRVLRARPGVDPNRIAMAGTSHGGIITLLAVTRMDLAAAVCAYGVADTFTWYKYLTDNGFDVSDPLSLKVYGKGPADKPEAFSSRAPALNADKIHTPLLLLYGDKDTTVPLSQGQEMADALARLGKPYQLMVIEGATHGFIFHIDPTKRNVEERARADKAWKAMLAFLKVHL